MIDTDQHIENSLDDIRKIFKEAAKHIDAIEPGCKIPATALAETLAKQFDTKGPQLYPVLKYLFNNYPGVKILRGAHGGIMKLKVAAVTDPPETVEQEDQITEK